MCIIYLYICMYVHISSTGFCQEQTEQIILFQMICILAVAGKALNKMRNKVSLEADGLRLQAGPCTGASFFIQQRTLHRGLDGQTLYGGQKTKSRTLNIADPVQGSNKTNAKGM